MSLKYKILLFIFLPIFMVSFLSIKVIESRDNERISEEINQRFIKKLERINSQIEKKTDTYVNITKFIANIIDTKKNQEEISKTLKGYINNYEHIIEITLISRQSVQISRAHKYTIVDPKETKYHFNKPYYQYPMLNSAPFIGNFRVSKDTAEPLIDVAVPIKNIYSGELWGILKITFSGNHYLDYIKQEAAKEISIGGYNYQTEQKLFYFGDERKEFLNNYKNAIGKDKFIANDKTVYTSLGFTTNRNFLIYLAIPNRVIKENISSVKTDYINTFYLVMLILFAALYTVLSIATKTLEKTAEKIKELSRKFADEQGFTQISKTGDEIQNLNDTIEVFELALEDAKKKEYLLSQQSKMTAMGEMMGNIAHQWRQPLSILSLKKDEVVDSFHYNELNQETIEKFSKETNEILQYLSKTIDDFRNFFKQSKKSEMFRVTNSIDKALTIVNASLKNSYILLNKNYENSELSVYGLENEFEHAIINLVNNSKDAILTNKIENGEIDITVTERDGDVVIVISDNGGGIPDDILEKVFEPYFTTKFQSQGTGIGLYMTKNIIENMQGEISAKNINSGAEFTMSLPKK